MKYLDKWLNNITMYRVALYSLRLLAVIAIIFSFLDLIDYSPWQLLATLGIIVVIGEVANFTAARLLNVPRNIESMPITALILFFIVFPVSSVTDAWVVAATTAVAMLSKYVLVYRNRHIFNPAALGVFIVGLFGTGIAGWWVGSAVLLVPVLFLGLLVIRKLRRFRLFFVFIVTALASTAVFAAIQGSSIQQAISQAVISGPLLFFAAFMLTEPLTMPPTNKVRILYGVLVGLLFGLPIAVWGIYMSPELALLVGNVVAFTISPARQLILQLKEKQQMAPSVYEYVFRPNQDFTFLPGQYMEWTLSHSKTDARGMRRYFTIASSPTEKYVRLAVAISDPASSYKQALKALPEGAEVRASQVAGDFVLPADQRSKLVFIAGGIGVTPFRSMIKYLIDTRQRRDIILLYSAKEPKSFAYKELFNEATKQIGLRVEYIVTDRQQVPKDWKGATGHLTPELLCEYIPDLHERTFYLSGPSAMVDSYRNLLKQQGVRSTAIKTDYFPGL